jgi:NADPH:quinone reductase-like Zn-dependent oxidoreductase
MSELAGAVMTETMKAIVQHRYGPSAEDVLRLAEVARPAIGIGEVLVKVSAASVDRGTWHIMTGLTSRLIIIISGDSIVLPSVPYGHSTRGL